MARINERCLIQAIRTVCGSGVVDGSEDCTDGGCAVFAVALNRFLGGADTDRVFAGSYSTDRGGPGPRAYYHVALRYRGKLYDGTGVTDEEALLLAVDRCYRPARIRHNLKANEALSGTDRWEDEERLIQTIQALLVQAYKSCS